MNSTDPTISKETVAKIAHLAHIHLSDTDLPKFHKDLTTILTYVEKINEVQTDVSKVKAKPEQTNIFRDDISEPSFSQSDALKNAGSRQTDGYFTVTSVLPAS